MEIWKDIKGYEGLYKISNFGRVLSVKKIIIDSKGRVNHRKERLIKGFSKKSKHLHYFLYKNAKRKTVTAHRLVMLAFVNNKENKPCINHKDGNPENNHISNLEWCTYSENTLHSYRVLKNTHGNKMLTDSQIESVRDEYGYLTMRFLADKYNVGISTIYNVIRKKGRFL